MKIDFFFDIFDFFCKVIDEHEMEERIEKLEQKEEEEILKELEEEEDERDRTQEGGRNPKISGFNLGVENEIVLFIIKYSFLYFKSTIQSLFF